MDHSQQQQQLHDDHSQNFVPPPYPMYTQEDDPYPSLVYSSQMPNYPVVPPGPPPRQLAAQMSESDIQQAMQYQRSLNMIPQSYPNPVFNASSPHGPMPLSASPPPQSPTNLYGGPLSPPISGSDTSAEGTYHSRNSSSAGSPSSSRANSLVHRNPLRYNPTPSPTSSSGRRSRGRSLSDDEDHMGVTVAETLANTRKEATRRQRIEAEQRRRDELRDGYARLKDVLPVSNQKSSKVSLLERATNHIASLEKTNRQLQARLQAVEAEVVRLRAINEKISLGVSGGPNGSPSPGHINMDSRPLSPPPEGSQITPIPTSDAIDQSSPSASEGEY